MKEYKYKINGNEYLVEIGDVINNIAKVTVNGEIYQVEMEKQVGPEKKKVVIPPVTPKSVVNNAPTTSSTRINAENALKAPLPGVIVEIKVAIGDEVNAGDTLVVLEAMKMANNLEAEKSGKVTDILVKVGESVMEDTPLVIVE